MKYFVFFLLILPNLTFARLSDDVEISINNYVYRNTALTGPGAEAIYTRLAKMNSTKLYGYNVKIDERSMKSLLVGSGFVLKKHAAPMVQLPYSTKAILDSRNSFSNLVSEQLGPFESLNTPYFHNRYLCAGIDFLTIDGDLVSFYNRNTQCLEGSLSVERLFYDWSIIDEELGDLITCFEVNEYEGLEPSPVACVYPKDKFTFHLDHQVDPSDDFNIKITGLFQEKLRRYLVEKQPPITVFSPDEEHLFLQSYKGKPQLPLPESEHTRTAFRRDPELLFELPEGWSKTRDGDFLIYRSVTLGGKGLAHFLLEAQAMGYFTDKEIDCYDGGKYSSGPTAGHGGASLPPLFRGQIATCIF